MREKEFLDALEEDTRRQCDEILENAQTEAEAIIKGVQEEWKRVKKEEFEKVDASLQRERIRIWTRAKLSAREVILKERRRLIIKIFEEVCNRFKEIRRKEDYPVILERLCREAMEKWGVYLKGRRPVVVVSGKDRDLLKNLRPSILFLGECEMISDDTEELSLGVMIKSEDGKYKIINTLQSRLERAKPEIESMIDKMLFGDSTG